jgi:hypothetical protein
MRSGYELISMAADLGNDGDPSTHSPEVTMRHPRFRTAGLPILALAWLAATVAAPGAAALDYMERDSFGLVVQLPDGTFASSNLDAAYLDPAGTVVYLANAFALNFPVQGDYRHDLATGTDTLVTGGLPPDTTSSATSADGRFSLVNQDGAVALVDHVAGTETPLTSSAFITSFAISADGRIIAIADSTDASLLIIDRVSGERTRTESLTGLFSTVGISISADGSVIEAQRFHVLSPFRPAIEVFHRVTDLPPVVHVQDLVVPTDPGQATASVAASAFDAGSSDPEGQPLTFVASPAGPYPLGTTTVVITVSDGTSSSTATATITVEDREPPRVVCGATRPVLFADGHHLVDIGLTLDARDNVRVIDIQISITQNEPVHAGPGDPSPDAVVRRDSAGHILGLELRAERDPHGHGRVYLISTTAIDTSGNRSTSFCAVVVPKSRSLSDLFAVIRQAVLAELARVPLPFDSEQMAPPHASG